VAAGWPLLSFRLHLSELGWILGLQAAVTNAMQAVVPLAIGALVDHARAQADAHGGSTLERDLYTYLPASWFLVALGVLVLGLAVWIAVLDRWTVQRPPPVQLEDLPEPESPHKTAL